MVNGAEEFGSLVEIVARLRAPDGCPWDREQTHETLRKHLLEESYEVMAAIDAADMIELREELGDLLLQIVMQAQIAAESGAFEIAEVIGDIEDKLVRRHPHVFGELKLDDADQVLRNWEHMKEGEKDEGVLAGVPAALPALAQAAELQSRAERIGLALVPGSVDDSLGLSLFSQVDQARRAELDPEAELQRTNAAFRARFKRLEQLADGPLGQLEPDELHRLWDQTAA